MRSLEKNLPQRRRRIPAFFLNISFFLAGCILMPLSVVVYKSIHNEGVNHAFIDKIVSFFSPRSYDLDFKKIKTIGSFLIHSSFEQVDEIELSTNFKNLNLFSYQLEHGPVRVTTFKDFEDSKGVLRYKHEEIAVTYKPKGDRSIHYRKEKPSLKVHVEGAKAILGMSDFSLQSPLIRNYVGELAWIRTLEKEGLIVPNYGFLNLRINAKDYGIYSYEEGLSTFMLERKGYKNSSIVGFDESSSTNMNEAPELKILNQKQVSPANIKLCTALLRSFIERKNKVSSVFDIDKMASFFAISDLYQAHHGIVSKSVRFYYNPITNLLEPIPFDGHTGSNIDNSFIAYDFTKQVNSWVCSDSLWFKLFFNESNKDFTAAYFAKLAKFSSEKYITELLASGFEKEMLSNIYKIYKDVPLEDRISYGGPYLYYFDIREFLTGNAANIRNKLNNRDIQVYSTLDAPNNKIEIEIRNLSRSPYPVSIQSFSTKNNKQVLNTGLLEFDREKNKISAKITVAIDSLPPGLFLKNSPELSLNNAGNNTIIKKLKLIPYDFHHIENNNGYLQECLKERKLISRGDTLIIKNARIQINDILIIPGNKTLLVEQGAVIEFTSEQSGLIVYGKAEMVGTKDKRIRFRGVNGYKGFLVFIRNGQTKLDHVDFSNLFYPENYDISGSVTFYKTDALITECFFDNNHAEDFINIVNSSFSFSHSKIFRSASDAIDLDFSNGKIEGLSIENAKNDGIDASGSSIYVSNTTFFGIGDKCVSGGEVSAIDLNGLSLNNSELGIVSKDGSKITGNHLYFSGVKVPAVAFIKKSRYENPELTLLNSLFTGYRKRELIQEGISIRINAQTITGNLEDVSSLLYGQEYGIKTVKNQ